LRIHRLNLRLLFFHISVGSCTLPFSSPSSVDAATDAASCTFLRKGVISAGVSSPTLRMPSP